MTLPLRPKTSTRGNYRFAELALTRGPVVIGGSAPSVDVLLARVWAVELRADDHTLRAYQQQPGGSWLRVTADLPPVFDAPLPAAARRVSVAFDQSSRLLIAYEDEGVIKVTRWDTNSGEYVQNVSVAGHDPAVVIDAAWTGDIPSSDVLLFYLSSDRERVMCRVQREVYATERELFDYGAPVILDRVEATLGRYQLRVSDAAGDPLEYALVSGLYGYAGRVGMRAQVEALPTAGEYPLIVVAPPLATQELAGQVEALPTAGQYVAPVIELTAETQELAGQVEALPTAGQYINRVIELTAETQGLAGQVEALPTAGEYPLVVLTPELTAQGLAGAVVSLPTGGTYVAT